MGEMTQEGGNASAGFDLSQFYQVFFEEAGENLDSMEQMLLQIEKAYAANARVIATVDQMMQSLLEI